MAATPSTTSAGMLGGPARPNQLLKSSCGNRSASAGAFGIIGDARLAVTPSAFILPSPTIGATSATLATMTSTRPPTMSIVAGAPPR
jgi:hypothetical protein